LGFDLSACRPGVPSSSSGVKEVSFPEAAVLVEAENGSLGEVFETIVGDAIDSDVIG
jgi:hypothetical protein